jgi:hypothetical protein
VIITIDLTPEEEAWLIQQVKELDMTIEEYLHELIEDRIDGLDQPPETVDGDLLAPPPLRNITGAELAEHLLKRASSRALAPDTDPVTTAQELRREAERRDWRRK